jgi:hypothetical protein
MVLDAVVTITLTSIMIFIITKAADANEEHPILKQQLLELKLAYPSQDIERLIVVLDHIDEVDAVKVMGVKCSRVVVRSVFAFLFSVAVVLLRSIPISTD